MKIVLCDINDDVVKAFEKIKEKFDSQKGFSYSLEVYKGSILNLSADATISPANSYGLMLGGIDGVYARHFGKEFTDKVLSEFEKLPNKQLPVGNAKTISTNDKKIKNMIFAPTMKNPGTRLKNGNSVYKAVKAAFLEAKKKKFNTVLFPGMGTGVGGLSVDEMQKSFEMGLGI